MRGKFEQQAMVCMWPEKPGSWEKLFPLVVADVKL